MTGPAGTTRYKQQGGNRVGLVARVVAAELLERIVDNRQPLDALCDDHGGYYRFRALIAKDRALVRAILVTALRHRGRIEHILSRTLDRKPPAKARHLIHTLHVAVAQLLYMDIPESAAVNLAVTALKEDRRSARFAAMANAVLRRITREREELIASASAWQLAFPEWLARRIRRDFGQEKAERIAQFVSAEPNLDLTLRPNIEAAKRDDLLASLDGRLLATGSARVSLRTRVDKLAGYDEGLWWVQDAASALPARMLGSVNGLQVADLCAAPGGKTAQLAGAGAIVTAVDISADRLQLLRENLSRIGLGASIVDADILEWKPSEPFDAVLLDAPCSSTGTIRRHPDVAWTKTESDVASLASLQRELIAAAAALLRPGGVLVYANCSLLKEEGEDLVAGLDVLSLGLQPFPLEPDEIPGISGLINRQGALRTLPFNTPAGEIMEDRQMLDIEEHATKRLSGGMDGFFAMRFLKLDMEQKAAE